MDKRSIFNNRIIVRDLKQQYRRGGFKALIGSVIEGTFINILQHFPVIYNLVIPSYYRWRSSNDIYQSSCSPDPFKIEYVPPELITHKTGRDYPYFYRRKLFGTVIDGDWDLTGIDITNSRIYNSFIQHFEKGISWEKTKLVERSLFQLKQGITDPREFQSREDIFRRCKKWEQLYESVDSEGYRMQKELLSNNEYNDGLFLDELDEIAVDIGRNGELLLADGRHRLYISKILELDKIPVVFLVRHKEWMEYREKLCQNDEPIPDHPDLRDLK